MGFFVFVLFFVMLLSGILMQIKLCVSVPEALIILLWCIDGIEILRLNVQYINVEGPTAMKMVFQYLSSKENCILKDSFY